MVAMAETQAPTQVSFEAKNAKSTFRNALCFLRCIQLLQKHACSQLLAQLAAGLDDVGKLSHGQHPQLHLAIGQGLPP